MKKFICAMLAFAMLCFVVGCGNKDFLPTEPATEDPTEIQTQPVEEPTQGEAEIDISDFTTGDETEPENSVTEPEQEPTSPATQPATQPSEPEATEPEATQPQETVPVYEPDGYNSQIVRP